MKRKITILAAAIFAVGTLALGAGVAQAAAGGSGPNSNTVQLDCGGTKYTLVSNDNAAQFSPAHIVGGGTIVPISFGETTITFTDETGTHTMTDPAATKPGHVRGDTVNCSFSFTGTDPESGGTFSVSGTVTGIIHGGHNR